MLIFVQNLEVIIEARSDGGEWLTNKIFYAVSTAFKLVTATIKPHRVAILAYAQWE